MSGHTCFMACAAFMIAALDAFAGDHSAAFPEWVWFVIGVNWLLHIPVVIMEWRSEAARRVA